MAINIKNKPNVTAAGGDFEFAKIKDETSPGANDGVPINDNVYGDFHQFFAKIIEQAGITYNDLPENLTNGYQYLDALKKLFVQTIPGNELITKVIEIGDWDMSDATGVNEIDVAHGLTHTKIRSVNVIIQNDNQTNLYEFGKNQNATVGHDPSGISVINSTVVKLRKGGSGTSLFGVGTSFNLTPFNRGWVTITHEV